MKMNVLVFGEVIWDVYPDNAVIGGAPFNFSAHVSLLGNEVHLITATGNDELGAAACEEMHKYGIRTDLVQKNGYPTGSCTVTLDRNGIPAYEVHRDVAYDHIRVHEEDVRAIRQLGADVFYFNTLIQREAVSRQSLITILNSCRFEHVFCDVNIREDCFTPDSLRLCMEKATIIKISDEEAHHLYDTGVLRRTGSEFVQDVATQFPNIKTVVYTMGKDGSAVYDAVGGKMHRSGCPEPVTVVSTVGAGDCYGATFLDAFVRNGDIDRAIAEATERSNIVVSSREAVPFL